MRWVRPQPFPSGESGHERQRLNIVLGLLLK